MPQTEDGGRTFTFRIFAPAHAVYAPDAFQAAQGSLLTVNTPVGPTVGRLIAAQVLDGGRSVKLTVETPNGSIL